MNLAPEDQAVEDEALVFVSRNRRAIARKLTDVATYPAEKNPVAVFMAGSPGAGKTEASQALVERLGGPVLRIDPDDYRQLIPGYNGKKSCLFQRAVGKIVEKVLDEAFGKRQSFILDGTLSNYDVAFRNISRALAKGRVVQILYVFQEPCQAWRFVKDREALDGRNIPVDVFVGQYFAARDVVNRLKEELGRKIKVDLIIKNLDGGNRVYEGNIQAIDGYVKETYSVRSLSDALGILNGSQHVLRK
jgi:predicted ABC-type ATPase